MAVRMGRGRRGLPNDLAVLPWPLGLAVGVLGFDLIRYGIPAWASSQSEPLAQPLGRTDVFAPLAWIVLALCVMASLFSSLGSCRRTRLRRPSSNPLRTVGARQPLVESRR